MVVIVWLAFPARVMLVPLIAVIGSPSRVAPTTTPAVTLATVTSFLSVPLAVTLTL